MPLKRLKRHLESLDPHHHGCLSWAFLGPGRALSESWNLVDVRFRGAHPEPFKENRGRANCEQKEKKSDQRNRSYPGPQGPSESAPGKYATVVVTGRTDLLVAYRSSICLPVPRAVPGIESEAMSMGQRLVISESKSTEKILPADDRPEAVAGQWATTADFASRGRLGGPPETRAGSSVEDKWSEVQKTQRIGNRFDFPRENDRGKARPNFFERLFPLLSGVRCPRGPSRRCLGGT